MADPRTLGPGARWPLRRSDLDDVEMLEMMRDDDGRLVWKSQTAPASPEALRTWMPKRRRDAPDAPAPLPHAPECVPPADPWLPTRLDMSDAPAVSLAELLPDLCPAGSPAAWPPPVEQSPDIIVPTAMITGDGERSGDRASLDPAASAGVEGPPLRLVLAEPRRRASAPEGDGLAEPSGATGTAKPASLTDILERLALVAAGMLIGTVLTIVWGMSAGQPVAARRDPARAAQVPGKGMAEIDRPAVRELVPSAGAAGAATATRRTPVSSSSSAPGRLHASSGGTWASGDDLGDEGGSRGAIPEASPTEAAGRAVRVDSLSGSTVVPGVPAGMTHTPVKAARTRRPAAAAAAALPPTRGADRGGRTSARAARPRPVPPAVLDVVRQYAVAYSRMDARATRAVWPTADREALASTFNGLREQRLTLSGCRGDLIDVGAAVACRGTLRYRPRLGDHSTRTRQGTWRFALAPDGDIWRIDLVTEP